MMLHQLLFVFVVAMFDHVQAHTDMSHHGQVIGTQVGTFP
jgi:hypothetical protein